MIFDNLFLFSTDIPRSEKLLYFLYAAPLRPLLSYLPFQDGGANVSNVSVLVECSVLSFLDFVKRAIFRTKTVNLRHKHLAKNVQLENVNLRQT